MAEEIKNIAICDIKLYGGNRYFALDEKKVDEYAESIMAVGIQEPLIVRPFISDGIEYELIAGEHRLRAAQKAGLKTVPAIVRQMTDEQAQLCYGETNRQREKVTTMEKAYMAYYDYKYGSSEKKDELSERHRQDLIKLTMLTKPLQNFVDVRKITVKAGAKAASLPVAVQNEIFVCLEGNKKVLTELCVDKIKLVNDTEFVPYGQSISPTKLEEILSEYQPKKVKKVHLSISRKLLRRLPEEYRTREAQEELVEELIKDYLDK